MPNPKAKKEKVSVVPTKELFVFIITRDIEISDAVVDLIDNSVDGAKRLREENATLEGLKVEIDFDEEGFSIKDNCGGIPLSLAQDYAFRFGRADQMPETPGSVGQFGVGMKRALFKFGKKFHVESATTKDSFELNVDVKDWLSRPDDWTFSLSKTGGGKRQNNTGTVIKVTDLNQEALQAFSDPNLKTRIFNETKKRQQLFIEAGLQIVINGIVVESEMPELLSSESKSEKKLRPSFWRHEYKGISNSQNEETTDVSVEMHTGVGISSPEQAGWYVYCNGRAVLTADKTDKTGWAKSGMGVQYHNQFARFRGYVYFRSDNAGALPWTTTKADIDETNSLYRQVLQKMIEQGRPVIDFLNVLDKEKDLPSRDRSYEKMISKAQLSYLPKNAEVSTFEYDLGQKTKKQKMTTISFKRPSLHVEQLMEEKDVSSAKQLGEDLFDEAYDQYVE